ncbi:acetyl-CoA acetyltransferase [Caballeronia choica]|uniref:Acetyl-CoA acetyltransferase n=1 Tax=Caballeronia choica TaxID=326476 RepID=A0A158JLG7_9BURK|nr:acetyl-CoA C-acetyltransferase [Caballeronia choica]SAL69714.1 acetyl-CoA acetyltransferase [Caballeronia choica]
MRRAAIVAPVRTPVGTFGGGLRSVPVEALAATVIRATLERTGIDPARIEDVVFAQSYASSETPCIGRWAALEAGLPVEVPGMQLDRRCGGGLQAVVTAAMMVQSGAADVVIAGGVESMSNIEYYTTDMRWGSRAGSVRLHDRLERGRERSQPEARFGYISGMIETAENLVREYGITREAADEYAVRSHQRAADAWASGRFDEEVVPVSVPQRKGEPLLFTRDEGVRADASVESLGKLRALTKDGTVTAGNASQQNDAAAACLIVAEDKLAELKLTPLAYLTGWAAAGCEPAKMGIGPVPAVRKLLKKTGLTIDQIDLVELNEAFACQVLAVLKGWGWDDRSRLNVNGSAISLGHPIGATGVRMLATLLHELQRRKGRYGLETMCIGGGQGIAAIFERA